MRSVVLKNHPAAVRGEQVTLFRSHHPEYEDGGQMRDFVYVKDCERVVLWLMENRDVNGLFNLGTGRAQTWLELMRALYSAVGQELAVDWVDTPEEIRDRYQYYTQADMARLRAAGYDRPFRSVEEGVADYVERHLSREDPYR
jgi:ADP-L-glycero-D-manno-heptose 6-epimerase